jgi:3-methyladenine DNA glycosylase AlkD
MTSEEILGRLRPLGSDSYKRVMFNHGVQEPLLGVKVAALKVIQKEVKKDHGLSLELYRTGIYDAQYLAGLIADPALMTEAELREWMGTANCGAIQATTVACVAAESAHGRKLALEWIESPDEHTAAAGWTTLTSLVSITPDSQLDLAELEGLLRRVEQTIRVERNRVRYSMNGFVIGAGSFVSAFTDLAIAMGERIGKVSVDMGNTACEVPYAPDYIRKVQARGAVGKKRKSAMC